MNTTNIQNKLLVKIVCLNGVKYEKNAISVLLNIKDGLISINKNYCSIIEEVYKGKVKIQEAENTPPITFLVSDGWIVVSKNVCEIFVATCEKK